MPVTTCPCRRGVGDDLSTNEYSRRARRWAVFYHVVFENLNEHGRGYVLKHEHDARSVQRPHPGSVNFLVRTRFGHFAEFAAKLKMNGHISTHLISIVLFAGRVFSVIVLDSFFAYE